MSKLLPLGDTYSSIFDDLSIKTLDSIIIGRQAAKGLNNIENIVIGKYAGNLSQDINNCIFLGNNAGQKIIKGKFNIIFGKNNYQGISTNIISFGFNNYCINSNIIFGNDNSSLNINNINFGYNNFLNTNNIVFGKNIISKNNSISVGIDNYIYNNSIILGSASNLNNNSIIIGYNSNIYGESIIIGNDNTNKNDSIFLGSRINTKLQETPIIIGNDINDYIFSLNIDNTICKYTSNNQSILYLGIGENIYDKTSVVIGFKEGDIINDLIQNNLYIKGGLKSDKLIINNNNNSISLIVNSSLNNNIVYNLPPYPSINTPVFLSTDINGNLFWINMSEYEVKNLIISGECRTVNINANFLEGNGNSLFNLNLSNNNTDDIEEGIQNLYLDDIKLQNSFLNFIDKIDTTYINDDKSKLNYYFNSAQDLEYFYKNINNINIDYIKEGSNNLYYTKTRYLEIINQQFQNLSTNILNSGKSNLYFNLENHNKHLEYLYNYDFTTDNLKEGTSNLYYNFIRHYNITSNIIYNISLDNIKEGSSNLYYSSNIINNIFSNITTDDFIEGNTNKYITEERMNNVLKTFNSDYYNEGISNLYYKNNILDSDYIKEGNNNLYFNQTKFKDITTNDIKEGTSNFFYNQTTDFRLFNKILGSVNNDIINDGIINTFLSNNTYNSNLNIKGTISALKVNNIDNNINTEPNIGTATNLNEIYRPDEINFDNSINEINLQYIYETAEGGELYNEDYVPFTINNNYVGINNQNPIYNLDIIGTTKSDNFIGDGSNIINLEWSNINNKLVDGYYNGQFYMDNKKLLRIKSIITTNYSFPLINNNTAQFNLINETNDYYYKFEDSYYSIKFEEDTVCQIFMIGGGGGGGDYYGGGGGAGGYYYGNFTFESKKIYELFIGSGGLGSTNNIATNGGNTYIYTDDNIVKMVYGGGAGGGYIDDIAQNGGCGGGGKGYNDSVLNNIFNGGDALNINEGYGGGKGITFTLASGQSRIIAGGGGGGINSMGSDAYSIGENKYAGNGGSPKIINISGIEECYGGGGGGGCLSGVFQGLGGSIINSSGIKIFAGGNGGTYTSKGQDAILKGSGGGGGGFKGLNNNYDSGGNGQNGIIIIRFTINNINRFIANNDNFIEPSFTWDEEKNTGISKPYNNTIGISIDGIDKLIINKKGLIGNGYGLSNIEWSNIANKPPIITQDIMNNYINNTDLITYKYINSNVASNLMDNYIPTNILPKYNTWNKLSNNINYLLGNVGIGITNPTFKLDINGIVKIGNNNNGYLTLNFGGIENNCGYVSFYNSSSINLGIVGSQAPINNYLYLNALNSSLGYYTNANFIIAGNVGIGITNPTEKIEINGEAKLGYSYYNDKKFLSNINNITIVGWIKIATYNNWANGTVILVLSNNGRNDIIEIKINMCNNFEKIYIKSTLSNNNKKFTKIKINNYLTSFENVRTIYVYYEDTIMSSGSGNIITYLKNAIPSNFNVNSLVLTNITISLTEPSETIISSKIFNIIDNFDMTIDNNFIFNNTPIYLLNNSSDTTIKSISSLVSTNEICGLSDFNNDIGQLRLSAGGNTNVNNKSYIDIYGNNITSSIIFGINGDEKVRINKNGFLGIGIDNPLTFLHVNNDTTNILNSSSLNGNYITNASTISSAFTYKTSQIDLKPCAIFEGKILCKDTIVVSSDERIKTNIENINNKIALEKILKIKPKIFNYIDNIIYKNRKDYGFIAQHINDIIPESIYINKDIIPNIYELGECDNNIISFSNKKNVSLMQNNTIRIIDNNNIDKLYNITSNISNNKFIINENIDTSKIFIYGTQIEDYYTIDKTHIYTLNISATQELHKLIINKYYKLDNDHLKENIEPLNNSLNIINNLMPVKFKWKNNDVDVGFNENEIKNSLPFSIDENNNMNYDKLIPYLVNSIKELTKRIIELEKK